MERYSAIFIWYENWRCESHELFNLDITNKLRRSIPTTNYLNHDKKTIICWNLLNAIYGCRKYSRSKRIFF